MRKELKDELQKLNDSKLTKNEVEPNYTNVSYTIAKVNDKWSLLEVKIDPVTMSVSKPEIVSQFNDRSEMEHEYIIRSSKNILKRLHE